MVGSSKANAFASCAAGVCALWGHLHGGANVAVMEMLEQIQKGGLTPKECIKLAKDKNSPFRLMGFGHRVYKNYDPRAKILKKTAEKVFQVTGADDLLLDIARELEELALKDPYFIERKLYPMRESSILTWIFTAALSFGPWLGPGGLFLCLRKLTGD